MCQRGAPCLRPVELELVGDQLGHLIERLNHLFYLLDDLDDVKSDRRLDQVADGARFHLERRRLELGEHLPSAEEVEVAAQLGGGFVFGVLSRQFGEIRASLGLSQNRFALLSNGVFILVAKPQQNVAGTHPPGGGIPIDVGVVGIFDFVRRDDERLGDAVDVNHQEADPSLFRHLVVARVLDVERGDILVARLHFVPVVVGPERDDAELDLLVAAPVLLLELGVRDGDPVGEHGLQPLDEQALTEALLELVRRDRRVL